jgi:Domain of unknown function (DUF4365)
MPLPQAHLLDELAAAYVQAIAAVAGATISVSRRDYGVDGTIKYVATTDKDGYFETGFPVEFQLKGTSVATTASKIVKYDLKARNYNLIVTRRLMATPYYLFLVCFGSDPAQWAVVNTALTLNASAFWWTASGMPSKNAASVRIEIPMENRLTFEAIGNILNASETRFAT